MSLFDSINDKCWSLMDWLWDRHIPVGAVFEKYNLPPILFPLMLVLLILVVFWLLAAPAAPACGNGVCSPPESCTTCPLDCDECPLNTSKGLVLTVSLTEAASEPVTVKIKDSNGKVIDSETGRQSTFEFTGITPQTLSAEVLCPNGKSTTVRPRAVTPSENRIQISLPLGCFDIIIGNGGNALKTSGTVVVTVLDSATGSALDATVKALRMSDNMAEVAVSTEDGMATLDLRADMWYYLVADSPGYKAYDGSGREFYMIGGLTDFKTINLDELVSARPGTLRACAASKTGPLQSGRISVLEVGGYELEAKQITASSGGCAVFEVDGGKLVKAALTSAPAGCASQGFSNPVTIEPGSDKTVTINASCGEGTAFVKVIVHERQGRVVTEGLAITLWNAVTGEQIPGSAPDLSLSMGSGGYTESVVVPANTLIQAKASDAPLGQVDTASGPQFFAPGEQGTIDIILGELARGGFDFQGASIVYTPAAPGSPVKIFVQQITYNGTVLTSQNSDVSVTINGEQYDATYVSGR